MIKRWRFLTSAGLVIFIYIVSVILFLHANSGDTSFKISGAAGAKFTGYYVRGGQRVEISGVLPWSLDVFGVTQFVFLKSKLNDKMLFEVRRGGAWGTCASLKVQISTANLGVQGEIHDHGVDAKKPLIKDNCTYLENAGYAYTNSAQLLLFIITCGFMCLLSICSFVRILFCLRR